MMVSGGADSTALLHLLSALAAAEPGAADDGLPHGFSLGVCHVNYGLRGDGSDADESFVRGLGDSLGVQVHTIRAPEPPHSGFQAWAREFRYGAAGNLCRWQGYNRIAVGHNRDDRVETFIYRLITYSGRRSLVVMPPRRGRVIRPLLFMTAREVRDYCRDEGIAFREDHTNRELTYRRNRIRHRVMPALAEVRPDFRERIEDTIALLDDEGEVLSRLTDEAFSEAVRGEGGGALSATAVSMLDRALARLVLRRWLAVSGGGRGVTRRHLDAIIGICGDSRGTRSLSLPGRRRLERRYDELVLVEDAGEDEGSSSRGLLELPVPGRVAFGGYEVAAEPLVRDETGADLFANDPLTAVIDADRLDGLLSVRRWRPGDRFRPLGMQGTKSLQDLFTDEKVPRSRRPGLPVVTCGDRIIWVCGLRMSEDFRVTSRSEHLIRLTVARRQIEDEVR